MELLATILAAVILGLILTVCVPTATANVRATAMRRFVTGMVGLEVVVAFGLFVLHRVAGGEPISVRLIHAWPSAGIDLGIYYDGATSLMLLLVAFVGFVVSRFSVRYLDGEASQGRYARWLSFTVGAVSLMVVAGDLLMFFAAWVMTSWGLHHLLLHYHHRPAAHRAAWTKFAISRLGDAFLIAALVLTYQSFGTLELGELFRRVGAMAATAQPTASHAAIAWLLMLGAVTKSAQFPFHVWLPDTMETPTPVSALMHAGIVNAGGYLVIRMSPLFVLAPESLMTLSLIGTFTAIFASVVMMTQPSIKRALAYSTIAQMGFMMLQCGLGAFSAAMLHIIAHSLYKAHAFLTSGSIVAQARSADGAATPAPRRLAAAMALCGAAVAAITGYLALLFALGVRLDDKPGGFVLAFILFLALTSWGWQVLRLGRRQTTLVGVAGIVGLCLVYVASYFLVDRMLAPTIATIDFPPAAGFLLVSIAAAFALLFTLHAVLSRRIQPAWLAPLQVHALNGFYIDALYHRVFASVSKS